MKLRVVLLALLALCFLSLTGQTPRNQAPIVSNVTAVQRTDGSGIVDISYDLNDPEADPCEVSLAISADGGSSYDIIPSPALQSGDFGQGIASGAGKQIVWNAGAEAYPFQGAYLYRVYADDGQLPDPQENFILVQGGTFNNGSSSVSVSSFWLGQFELTQAGYQQVMGVNPSYGHGEGNSYPVYHVSWFKALEYCNHRSLQEGLTPCYSYDIYGSNPDNWPAGWNNYYVNHQFVSCNFNASGYRLPTEAEWHFAARGGNQSNNYTYSGSNIIGDVAWYYDNSGIYGSGHPDYGTHPVGLKAPNELGFYDMTGNVWEWCWDIYGTLPTTPQIDPTGLTSGSTRVIRGGSWVNYSGICPISFRWYYYANHIDINIGLRVLRRP